jgi:hypothetical protein
MVDRGAVVLGCTSNSDSDFRYKSVSKSRVLITQYTQHLLQLNSDFIFMQYRMKRTSASLHS